MPKKRKDLRILALKLIFSFSILAFLLIREVRIKDIPQALANIDLFWLWHLLLAVLGLSVVARISRGKSLILVVIYAVLAVSIFVFSILLFKGSL